MNLQDSQNIKMSENVIIVDADYIDDVAFNLTLNFEECWTGGFQQPTSASGL